MTPTEPSGPEPADLGPGDEDAVRRMLADAGGPVPTPPEVQARLEETLAGLVASRATTAPLEGRRTEPQPTEPDPGGAAVTPLERAHRRRWPALVAAAAAVAAVGYGTVTVVQQTGSGGAGDAGGAGTSTDTSGGQAEAGAGADADAAEPPGTAFGGTARRLQREAPDAGAPPDVTPAFRGSGGTSAPTLAAAALSAAALGPWALGSGGVVAAPSPGAGIVVVCAAPPAHADEHAYRVRFRGASATLVLGPVTQGRRVAVVYGCARARPLDATVLPGG